MSPRGAYALGVVMGESEERHLLRILAHAVQQGCPLFSVRRDGSILHAIGSDDDPIEVHLQTGSPVADAETARETLVELARTYGLRGLVVQTDPTMRIDFDASFDALEAGDEFVVEAQAAEAETLEAPVVVGIPAYNEEHAVGSIVAEAREYADIVVVVDDGSVDETAERAAEAGAVVVEHPENRGYGAALRTLFEEGKRRNASSLVVLDADGQHSPCDIKRLLRQQEECGADIVIGSRFTGTVESDIPLYRRFGIWVINVLTNVGLGGFRKENRISDTQSGFRAYGAKALQTLADDETLGSNMRASTDILFHAREQGHRIDEVGVRVRYDLEDTYTENPISHGYSVVRGVLPLIERERPLTTVGVPGFVSTFVGLSLGFWSVFEYGQSGQFPIEVVFVSLVLLLVGFVGGVVAIVHQSLREAEIR
ncbi:glycosyltransferase family 2 protein [Haloprofundus salilacus]|uniref:glycosyltransferase family 2 protein n=1 Tax=Haloprofundus salilacus TaxID=2876190 RepID=UPI001CCE1976|nr:glycosyltransferase family 2 protein [Haloprofundus salilacus]